MNFIPLHNFEFTVQSLNSLSQPKFWTPGEKAEVLGEKKSSVPFKWEHTQLTIPPAPHTSCVVVNSAHFFPGRNLLLVVCLHRMSTWASPLDRFTTGMSRKESKPQISGDILEDDGGKVTAIFPYLKPVLKISIPSPFQESPREMKVGTFITIEICANEQCIDQSSEEERCSNIYPEHFTERRPWCLEVATGRPRAPTSLPLF